MRLTNYRLIHPTTGYDDYLTLIFLIKVKLVAGAIYYEE